MTPIIAQLKSLRIIPIAVVDRAEDAIPLADMLVEGGLPCVEIVLRTTAATDAIRSLSNRSDILVGAGTILTIDQVKVATEAGAHFVISPGFNPKVADYCFQNRIVHFPGVCTPG